MGPERRKHKRIQPPKGTAAAWKSAGKSGVSRVKDIGLGGAFILTKNPPSAGSSVDILLSCTLGEMRARAMVCRSMEGSGMGLKFTQMAAHDRAKLNQFVTQPEAQQTAKSAAIPPSQQNPPSAMPLPVATELEKSLIAIAQVARTGTIRRCATTLPAKPMTKNSLLPTRWSSEGTRTSRRRRSNIARCRERNIYGPATSLEQSRG